MGEAISETLDGVWNAEPSVSVSGINRHDLPDLYSNRALQKRRVGATP
jgi:hypothetical protein